MRPWPQETEAVRDRKESDRKESDSLCYGVLQNLTLAHRNGKKTDVIRQKGDSGVEDSTIASGVEGLSCRIINVI